MTPSTISEDFHEVCERARSAAISAYAPYSHFRVGAAARGKKGIYIGVNVENSSYGLSICAERVALAAAIANGDRVIDAIAVACIDGNITQGIEEFVPCGGCLQWISELAPFATILICEKNKEFKINSLLPLPFSIKQDVKK